MQPPKVSRRAFLVASAVAPMLSSVRISAYKNLPVGLEMYTVRNALAKDLMGTVRAVAGMGYQVIEFFAPYFDWTPQTAADVRKLMDDLGIVCHSTHNNTPSFTDDGLKKAIELNQIIGSHFIVMASAGRVVGADGWKGVAETLTKTADVLRPLGMATGYHNHQAEWQPVDGQRPMDILAANTPKDVMLQFDVGTCVEVGADPIAWIDANPGRIRSVHCKDWAPTTGYATLFGEGVAPWARIFDAAEATGGVEYYLIEQELGPVGEELQRAERCLANWKRLRG